MDYTFEELWSFSTVPRLLSAEDQEFLKKLAVSMINDDACELLGYFNAFMLRSDRSLLVALEILKSTSDFESPDFLKNLIQRFHHAKLF